MCTRWQSRWEISKTICSNKWKGKLLACNRIWLRVEQYTEVYCHRPVGNLEKSLFNRESFPGELFFFRIWRFNLFILKHFFFLNLYYSIRFVFPMLFVKCMVKISIFYHFSINVSIVSRGIIIFIFIELKKKKNKLNCLINWVFATFSFLHIIPVFIIKKSKNDSNLHILIKNLNIVTLQ